MAVDAIGVPMGLSLFNAFYDGLQNRHYLSTHMIDLYAHIISTYRRVFEQSFSISVMGVVYMDFGHEIECAMREDVWMDANKKRRVLMYGITSPRISDMYCCIDYVVYNASPMMCSAEAVLVHTRSRHTTALYTPTCVFDHPSMGCVSSVYWIWMGASSQSSHQSGINPSHDFTAQSKRFKAVIHSEASLVHAEEWQFNGIHASMMSFVRGDIDTYLPLAKVYHQGVHQSILETIHIPRALLIHKGHDKATKG